MENSYYPKRSNKTPIVLILVGIVVVAGVGILFSTKGKKTIISPIPPTPSFEVIFYTPTPGEITPISSPSPTPKNFKSPTPTKKAASPTVTKSATKTPTPKTTLSPTKRPTATPTTNP